MADYSAQATGLAAPQAAGSQVIQPVREEATSYSPALALVGDIVGGVSAFLKKDAAKEAEERKNKIVGQYIQEQTRINDAIEQGLPADQAGARSRASSNKFLASYPEYFKDFEAANKAIKGITEQGEAVDEVTMQKNLHKERVSRAQAAGYSIDTSAPKSVQDAQLRAYDAVVRADAELNKLYRHNAENRAANAEERAVQDRELKRTSIRLINEIAGTRLESTGAFLNNVATEVKGGKMSPEEGQLKIANEFSTIMATLQSAASTNPELAAPYRTLFEDMHKAGLNLIDPKKIVDRQEDEIKMIINRSKLLLLNSDPKVAGVVATSQMLGTNAEIALAAGNIISPVISQMVSTPVGSTEQVDQVVGKPGVEKDVISFMTKGIQSLNGGRYKDNEKAKVEITNGINQILIQTGQELDKGQTSPTKLKDLATFFASPEYGSFAKSGSLDKAAAAAANKTFQLVYEPAVIKGVQQKLDAYLIGQASFGQKQGEPVPLSSTVNIKFTGSGVVFEPKARAGLDPQEQVDAARGVKDLQGTQAALNQLIHIGAHMAGTTDYEKFWEQRKHVFLPQLFPEPQKLKAGDVVNGYKYTGGPYGDPRSWQPVEAK